jgi:hypothetical protein
MGKGVFEINSDLLEQFLHLPDGMTIKLIEQQDWPGNVQFFVFVEHKDIPNVKSDETLPEIELSYERSYKNNLKDGEVFLSSWTTQRKDE